MRDRTFFQLDIDFSMRGSRWLNRFNSQQYLIVRLTNDFFYEEILLLILVFIMNYICYTYIRFFIVFENERKVLFSNAFEASCIIAGNRSKQQSS